MNHYTFLNPVIGGILIGLASLVATVLRGKVPGISGVFGRLLVSETSDEAWRLVFLLSLIGSAALSLRSGRLVTDRPAASDQDGNFRFGLRPRQVLPGPSLANLDALRAAALVFVPCDDPVKASFLPEIRHEKRLSVT